MSLTNQEYNKTISFHQIITLCLPKTIIKTQREGFRLFIKNFPSIFRSHCWFQRWFKQFNEPSNKSQLESCSVLLNCSRSRQNECSVHLVLVIMIYLASTWYFWIYLTDKFDPVWILFPRFSFFRISNFNFLRYNIMNSPKHLACYSSMSCLFSLWNLILLCFT